MKTEGLLPCSPQTNTGRYAELQHSSHTPHPS